MTTEPLSESNESTFPRRFGAYVLVTHLGEGGMGRVYAALTPKGDLCVVKRFGNPRALLPSHLVEQNKVRFLREAEITKALHHPGIARTYESVNDGSHSYLVQEYVSGMTLDYLMGALTSAEQHLPIPLATHIATRLVEALAYLHDFRGLGLIHRDLTATNVMLSQKGDVKVIDFGIAKATLAGDNLTQPNLVVGKPLWTSPEVRQGATPDRRTDLYALGMLYWYLLSGEDPTDHLGENPRSQLPGPSTFRPEIPTELDALVLRAVHVDPHRRFQNAAEFQTALTPFFPSGYDGATELGTIVRRNQLSSEDEFFAALVNRARPLMGQASVTTRWSLPSHGRRVLGVVAVALLLSGGAVLVLYRPPPQLTVAPPSPPPLRPIPAPPSELGEHLATPDSQPIGSAVVVPPAPPAESPSVPPPRLANPVSPPSSPPLAAPLRPSRAIKPKTPTAVETPPPQVPAPPDSQALLASAMQATASGDAARAVRLARASIEARPSADAYILIGKLLSTSDPTAAHAALEAALRLSPGNPQATSLLQLLNRGRF